MIVTTCKHVRLLSSELWLVNATKVYPGVGADVVMESLPMKDRVDLRSKESKDKISLSSPVPRVGYRIRGRSIRSTSDLFSGSDTGVWRLDLGV